MSKNETDWKEYKRNTVPIILAGLLGYPNGVYTCSDSYAIDCAFRYVDKIIERLKEEEENEDNIS